MADPADEVDAARRKLLRAFAYAAPLVVSSVVVKTAKAQPLSCGPNSCHPAEGSCGPLGACAPTAPCGPLFCRPGSP